jgi:hypothetical protein
MPERGNLAAVVWRWGTSRPTYFALCAPKAGWLETRFRPSGDWPAFDTSIASVTTPWTGTRATASASSPAITSLRRPAVPIYLPRRALDSLSACRQTFQNVIDSGEAVPPLLDMDNSTSVTSRVHPRAGAAWRRRVDLCEDCGAAAGPLSNKSICHAATRQECPPKWARAPHLILVKTSSSVSTGSSSASPNKGDPCREVNARTRLGLPLHESCCSGGRSSIVQ